jgi:hypothetical protein
MAPKVISSQTVALLLACFLLPHQASAIRRGGLRESVRHIISGPDGLEAVSSRSGARRRLFNGEALKIADTINRKEIVTRPGARASVALEPLIRLGGWTGWHRGMWEPQLQEAAATASVDLKMNAVKARIWQGTTYQLVVTGALDSLERMSQWYNRRLLAQHEDSE